MDEAYRDRSDDERRDDSHHCGVGNLSHHKRWIFR
jgi:hypothetical protein